MGKENKEIKGEILLPSSKSISNRALIIQALCDENFQIQNLSDADDTKLLIKLLEQISKHSDSSNQLGTKVELDAKNSGTVFRFLVSFLCLKEGKWLLTGTERMKKRPIGVLVETLKKMGAKISYLEKQGFPPLLIEGGKHESKQVEIDASISSQFVSSLLLIAPMLENGLIIKLKNKIVSKPFIEMTINMMSRFGVDVDWKENIFSVGKEKYQASTYIVESDWTSASYWYEIVSFSDNIEIVLKGLSKKSIQGDSVIADIFEKLGVKTDFLIDGVRLSKTKNIVKEFEFDFSNYPDLAQTVAVTCAALNIKANLFGLENLKIKETDRLLALKNELQKLDVQSEIVNDSQFIIHNKKTFDFTKLKDIQIRTYDDHRMALAFSPLALFIKNIKIENPSVINKSYPGFWNDLKKVGFGVEIENYQPVARISAI